MALRQLMLRKKINDVNKALEELRKKDAEFEARETELAKAIEEAETDEEKEAVEGEIEEFEKEKEEHENAKLELDKEVAELEGELDDIESEEEPEEEEPKEEPEERGVIRHMEVRNMTLDEMVKRDDVKAFLGETRNAIREKRALTNVGLLVPTVMLGLLRENITEYSKLYKHVNVRSVSGDGRITIMGEIPEAIWTDCCADLNELDLTFYSDEFDCWRIGGYYAICNATLEDSDIDLAAEIMRALGQGIGLGVDKAILYGLGTRMPLGIVTRLAQASAPADYPQIARPWVDLSTTNIKSIAASVKGADLFTQMIVDAGAAKGAFSRGSKVWVMNETTYTNLIANATSVDSSGAIVSGVNGTMPVIGGVIEVLSFVPDNVIIGGYFDLYTLLERGGNKFATSEHVRFLQDQTVFKGTARYDGNPTIAEAFVVIGLNGVTPTADMTFAPDTANATQNTGA